MFNLYSEDYVILHLITLFKTTVIVTLMLSIFINNFNIYIGLQYTFLNILKISLFNYRIA